MARGIFRANSFRENGVSSVKREFLNQFLQSAYQSVTPEELERLQAWGHLRKAKKNHLRC